MEQRIKTTIVLVRRSSAQEAMTKGGITQQRLSIAAKDAVAKEVKKSEDLLKTRVDQNLLSCKYIGTDPKNKKLDAKARVQFEWRIRDMSAVSKLNAGQVLYGHTLVLPHSLKNPFLMVALPKAISEQKNLPFMADVQGPVVCRSIVLPKDLDDVKIKKGAANDKAEHYLIAKVRDDVWICLPEKAPIAPKSLVEERVVHISNMDAPITSGEVMRKTFAIGHFMAEVARAKHEAREVDLAVADAHFEKNAMHWNTKPRNVLVRWAANGQERVNEVPFSSIVKRR